MVVLSTMIVTSCSDTKDDDWGNTSETKNTNSNDTST